ncbi:MAG: DNA methyltransferase [Anaeromassilibacillus sp.]
MECVEWLVQLSSKQGDFLLDPYLGTGTTAIAAIRNKRRFIGCEIDSHYYEIAVRRINEERNTR